MIPKTQEERLNLFNWTLTATSEIASYRQWLQEARRRITYKAKYSEDCCFKCDEQRIIDLFIICFRDDSELVQEFYDTQDQGRNPDLVDLSAFLSKKDRETESRAQKRVAEFVKQVQRNHTRESFNDNNEDSGINQSGKSFNSEKSQSNKKIINKVFGPEKFEQEENETKAPRNLKLEYSQEDEELEKFRTRVRDRKAEEHEPSENGFSETPQSKVEDKEGLETTKELIESATEFFEGQGSVGLSPIKGPNLRSGNSETPRSVEGLNLRSGNSDTPKSVEGQNSANRNGKGQSEKPSKRPYKRKIEQQDTDLIVYYPATPDIPRVWMVDDYDDFETLYDEAVPEHANKQEKVAHLFELLGGRISETIINRRVAKSLEGGYSWALEERRKFRELRHKFPTEKYTLQRERAIKISKELRTRSIEQVMAKIKKLENSGKEVKSKVEAALQRNGLLETPQRSLEKKIRPSEPNSETPRNGETTTQKVNVDNTILTSTPMKNKRMEFKPDL